VVSDSDGDAEEGDDTDDEVVKAEAVDTLSLDDPVRMYLKEIGRIALLRKEQEVACAQLIELGDAAARDRLTEANLRLVVSIAKRYIGHGLSPMPLESLTARLGAAADRPPRDRARA